MTEQKFEPVAWEVDTPTEEGYYWLRRISYKGERMPAEIVQLYGGHFLFPGDAKPFKPNSTVFACALWQSTAAQMRQARIDALEALRKRAWTNQPIEVYNAIRALIEQESK